MRWFIIRLLTVGKISWSLRIIRVIKCITIVQIFIVPEQLTPQIDLPKHDRDYCQILSRMSNTMTWSLFQWAISTIHNRRSCSTHDAWLVTCAIGDRVSWSHVSWSSRDSPTAGSVVSAYYGIYREIRANTLASVSTWLLQFDTPLNINRSNYLFVTKSLILSEFFDNTICFLKIIPMNILYLLCRYQIHWDRERARTILI